MSEGKWQMYHVNKRGLNPLYSYKNEVHCMNRNEVELDEVNV